MIMNPMNGYNGFAIELKTPKGTGEIRDNQVAWLKLLSEQGYIVLQTAEYFRVDPIVKHKKEIAKLKRECNTPPSESVVCCRQRFSSHKY
jgi:hypothetical protein